MLFYLVDKELEMFEWLFFVWATKKNYLGLRTDPEKSRFITFEHLFNIILKHFSPDPEKHYQIDLYIKRVLDWHIDADNSIDNNIIRCLLALNLDAIAVDYMGVYNYLLNKELLIYCIEHGKNYFLQNALLVAAFDKMLFRDDDVINELLSTLKEGYCTNFILNIISLIDISVWKNNRMKSLIEIINDYILHDYHTNRLLLSPNPILSISLSCEILGKIADARRKFESECYQIR